MNLHSGIYLWSIHFGTAPHRVVQREFLNNLSREQQNSRTYKVDQHNGSFVPLTYILYAFISGYIRNLLFVLNKSVNSRACKNERKMDGGCLEFSSESDNRCSHVQGPDWKLKKGGGALWAFSLIFKTP